MAEMLQFSMAGHTASLIKTNEDGFITHEVVLIDGLPENALAGFGKAITKANELGWDVADPEHELITSEDKSTEWLPVAPKAVSVSFVGSALPDNALELAQGAGVPAVSLVKAEEPNEGKVRAWFTVDVPKGFEWQVAPDWASLAGI